MISSVLNAFLIFLFGGLGTMARYGIMLIADRYKLNYFIAYTFVNTLACFLFGMFYRADLEHHSRIVAPLLFVGFLGGLGSYTSFIYQVFHQSNILLTMSKLFLPPILGVITMYLGSLMIQKILHH